MTRPPEGTVTFLFTDIEGSTRLWHAHRAAMQTAYGRHDAILRQAVASQGGVVYKVTGDAVQAAFATAPAAIAAAAAAQLALAREDWTSAALPEPLRVRMALHAGDVDPGPDGDYRSPVLNRLGRLLGAGHGGQILLSQAVRQLAQERLPADVELRDLGEHRLKDLLEPDRIWQLVPLGLAEDFPPLATLDARRHNLPLQPTPFLGREAEVTAVTARLRDPAVRLLTLLGPGGTGKTRLALQAAAELADSFPDGVWFVPLASLTDPNLVLPAIAAALGVREEGGRLLPETLTSAVGGKELLLVLDNVEHLLAAAPAIGHLLAAAPTVTMLATSRAPLRLRGEREHPVPPLGLPRRKPPPTLAQLGQYEAVQLFIARARQIRPAFSVTNENAPAVAELCHRLDGLPLAIELAAARVRLLTPQAMLNRLEQRLPLLTGGARDAPARQQTLHGAIAWSYDLMAPDEQTLFRRLAVFAGGWSFEAAEAVAGSPASGPLGLDVFDGLERLAQHSLLRQEETAAGEPRFQMLETIRAYGLEQLAASGETDEMHQRHVAFFLAFAEEAETALRGPDDQAWLERLDLEHDNLRAALGWAVEHNAEAALRLSGSLETFWRARVHIAEGATWATRALNAGAIAPPAYRARALRTASYLALDRGNLEVAEALAAEAVALAETVPDEPGIGLVLLGALNCLGMVTDDQGDHPRATALYERGLAIARSERVRWAEDMLINNLGYSALVQGDLGRARPLLEESVTLSRQTGNKAGLAYSLHSLGEAARMEGKLAEARDAYHEAITLGQEVGDRIVTYDCLRGLARIVLAIGSHEAAARLFAAESTIHETTGVVFAAWDQTHYEQELAVLRTHLGEAAFAAAWELGLTLSLDEAMIAALAETEPFATINREH